MARSGIQAPLDKFRWTVEIAGFSKLGFTQCGVPKYSITEKSYAEGGAHLNPKSIIDKVAFTPVTLSVGVTNDTSFVKWATSPWDLINNNAATQSSSTDFGSGFVGAVGAISDNGAKVVPSEDSYPFSYRRKVKIEHVNRSGQVEVMYVLYNAYVTAFEPASDFDAMADDGLSIAKITLMYDGWDVKYAGIAGTLGNLTSGFLK